MYEPYFNFVDHSQWCHPNAVAAVGNGSYITEKQNEIHLS